MENDFQNSIWNLRISENVVQSKEYICDMSDTN